MILFLAGLQRISPELYEAAKVDGAKRGWQTFRYITLPQLRATSVAVLLLLLITAYQAFDEFFNLLGNSSFARPPLVYLYYTAQGNQDYGHGSAGAVILALLIMIVTLLRAESSASGRRPNDHHGRGPGRHFQHRAAGPTAPEHDLERLSASCCATLRCSSPVCCSCCRSI